MSLKSALLRDWIGKQKQFWEKWEVVVLMRGEGLTLGLTLDVVSAKTFWSGRGGRYPGPRKISQLPVWDRNWSVPTQILRTHKDPPKLSSSFLFLYFGGVIIEIRCCSSPQRFGSSISYKKAPFGRAIERKGGIQLKFAAEKRLPKQVIGRFCADLDTVPPGRTLLQSPRKIVWGDRIGLLTGHISKENMSHSA
jgi:hypothetical protein